MCAYALTEAGARGQGVAERPRQVTGYEIYGWGPAASPTDFSNSIDNLGFVTIPEPTTMSLVVLGGLGVLARRRRR